MTNEIDFAHLTFSRGRTWQDFVRAYVVVVDGEVVGTLKRSSEFTVQVKAGTHQCRATISKTGSRTISINLAPGETVHVDILPGTEGDRIQRALSSDQYLRIVARKG